MAKEAKLRAEQAKLDEEEAQKQFEVPKRQQCGLPKDPREHWTYGGVIKPSVTGEKKRGGVDSDDDDENGSKGEQDLFEECSEFTMP